MEGRLMVMVLAPKKAITSESGKQTGT